MCRDFLSHLLGLPMGGNVHEMIKTDIYVYVSNCFELKCSELYFPEI